MQKNEKESFREKLFRKLDVEPDVLPGGTLVEIRDRFVITVRGGGKILAYTPEEIRIELGGSELCVSGERLVCISYYPGAVGIEGRINGVKFAEGEI